MRIPSTQNELSEKIIPISWFRRAGGLNRSGPQRTKTGAPFLDVEGPWIISFCCTFSSSSCWATGRVTERVRGVERCDWLDPLHEHLKPHTRAKGPKKEFQVILLIGCFKHLQCHQCSQWHGYKIILMEKNIILMKAWTKSINIQCIEWGRWSRVICLKNILLSLGPGDSFQPDHEKLENSKGFPCYMEAVLGNGCLVSKWEVSKGYKTAAFPTWKGNLVVVGLNYWYDTPGGKSKPKERYYLEELQEVLTVMSSNPGVELVLSMDGSPSN